MDTPGTSPDPTEVGYLGKPHKNIVSVIREIPEGMICYRQRPDGCKREPTRLLTFDDETGCGVCDFHFELGKVDDTRLFIVDIVEPKVLPGFLSSVVMFRIRCPFCDMLVEYDNQILFTPTEYYEMPEEIECDNPECGKWVDKPDASRYMNLLRLGK